MGPAQRSSPNSSAPTPVPSFSQPGRLRPYVARDIARFCGISRDTLYRTRFRRHMADGLPRPYSTNPLLWDRDTVDAWRRGHIVPAAANDALPHDAATDQEYRDIIARAYGRRA